MIHIEGRNISPFIGNEDELRRVFRDHKLLTLNRRWREGLRDTFTILTHGFAPLAKEEIACFFPHDPSVPIDPYPTALLIVRLPRSVDASGHGRLAYVMELGRALERRLNQMRGTDGARVQVDLVDVAEDTRCHYVTPATLAQTS